MFERVAGELRATLGVDSAAMCARAGDEACGAKARSGRASRRGAKPPSTPQAPPVWRALEGAEGLAAVPVGGGRAWPGFETTRRAEGSRRGRLAGGPPPTGTPSGPAPQPGPPAPGTPAVPHSNNTGRGRRAGGQAALRPEICRGTSDSSRIYSPARRSTSCMMRPHTALTHATAATPRTRERQGRTCRKSSKP